MTATFEDKLKHKVPIEQSDICYVVVNTSEYKPDSLTEESYKKLYNDIITKAQKELSENYDADFGNFDDAEDREEKIHYYLFGFIDPFKIDNSLKEMLREAEDSPNSRVNLAMIINKEKSQKAADIITGIDKSIGTNTIYQDNEVTIDGQAFLTISNVDVADNMVCETFRVKYKTIQKDDESSLNKLHEAREEVWSDVQKMQDIYKKYQLWHRSPYDGAFMFRTKHGWLTTATRTPKNNIRKQDLSLILSFDEETETVTYVGDRLPSSDLPEFLVLVRRNEQALADEGESVPIIKYVAHFHKNEITRNPLFSKYAVPFYRYGVSESGHKFADELLEKGKAADGVNIHGKGRGFIILEHGLVRIGVKLKHLEDFLEEFGLE